MYEKAEGGLHRQVVAGLIWFKKFRSRAGEMAQWVTVLLGEAEDQSSDPQHHPDEHSGANLQPDCWGAGQRQRFPGVCWQVSKF